MPASNPGSSALAVDESREIVGSRVFDAPRALVWKAWSEPQHLAAWWGPNGFTNTIEKFEFRVGGEWKFVMHGPDGTDYMNRIIYREIVEPERIAYSHISGPLFEAEATFEEEGGKTRVTMRMTFESAELRNKVIEDYGAVEGLHQTLGRMGDYVATIQ